jgi:hypothetical protein
MELIGSSHSDLLPMMPSPACETAVAAIMAAFDDAVDDDEERGRERLRGRCAPGLDGEPVDRS